jgi:hypothetical protein
MPAASTTGLTRTGKAPQATARGHGLRGSGKDLVVGGTGGEQTGLGTGLGHFIHTLMGYQLNHRLLHFEPLMFRSSHLLWDKWSSP